MCGEEASVPSQAPEASLSASDSESSSSVFSAVECQRALWDAEEVMRHSEDVLLRCRGMGVYTSEDPIALAGPDSCSSSASKPEFDSLFAIAPDAPRGCSSTSDMRLRADE